MQRSTWFGPRCPLGVTLLRGIFYILVKRIGKKFVKYRLELVRNSKT